MSDERYPVRCPVCDAPDEWKEELFQIIKRRVVSQQRTVELSDLLDELVAFIGISDRVIND